jgi:hypothetical protein
LHLIVQPEENHPGPLNDLNANDSWCLSPTPPLLLNKAPKPRPTLKPHRNIQKPPQGIHGMAKAQKPAKRLCNPRTSLSRDRSLMPNKPDFEQPDSWRAFTKPRSR